MKNVTKTWATPPAAALAAALALLAGCAGPDGTRLPPPASPRPLGADRPAFQAATQPAPAAAADEKLAEEPSGPITLREALGLALLRNPQLAGASWDIRAAEARRLQAGLLPNPEFEAEVEQFGGQGELRGFRSAETTLALGQLVELGGKRIGRMRLADADRALAVWDYEARRIDVYAQTLRAFVELIAAQRNQALAEELAKISERMLQTATQRVENGKSAPLEKSKARVVLGESRLELERARRQTESLRQQLAATWGSTQARFTVAEGELEVAESIPTAQALAARIDQNPDLARWKTEMEQRQAALALEKARAVPDLTVRGGVKRLEESDDWAFVAGVSVPLPVFDRNPGGIRESAYKLAKAAEERRAAEARAHSSLAESYALLASAFAEITILNKEVLPAAHEAFDAADAGWREGKFGYLDVLDAQRTLFELKERYIESLAAYHRAAADVERLIGQDLKSIAEPRQEH